MNIAENISSPAGGEKEIMPKEKNVSIERNIYIEIEKKVIEKYAPLLMKDGESKTEAQLEWINAYAKKYRLFFDSQKDEIIGMYKEDPNKTIDYIEKQLEAITA